MIVDKNKNLKIILLGAPGSGKGTLAQEMCKFGFIQISTGDLFRKKLNEDNQEAKIIQAIINRGELIPDDIVNNLATQAILDANNQKQNIILDGYPRTVEQAKFLDNVTDIDYVLFLNVDEKVLFERITGRLTCNQCHKIYNIYTNPPREKDVCDVCNIPLSKRRDDNKESFIFRINEYKTKTLPLINYYKNNLHTKFIEIDQDNQTSTSEILKYVLSALDIK